MRKSKKSQHKKSRFSTATTLAISLVAATSVFAGHGFGMLSANTLGSTEFKDVSETDPNAVAIDFLQESEVIKGYEDGSFKPEAEINRAELMKILVEAQGVTPDPEEYKDCFTDIKEEWYAPYVCYAKEMEWVSGYEDGTFAPEKPVNKVEAIKMTINSQGFSEETSTCDTELFEDTDENAWYGKYLCVAKEKGLLEEGTDENYVPTEDITRGQVSENIFRAITIKKLNEKAFHDAMKENIDEALVEFKADKEKMKDQIESFKEELKQMKEEGLDEEDIKEQRKEFWEEMKTMQKENKEDMKEMIEKLKDTREELKQEMDDLKDLMEKCEDDCETLKQEFKEEHYGPKNDPNKGPHKEPGKKPEANMTEDFNKPEKTEAEEVEDTKEVEEVEEVKETEDTSETESEVEETKTEDVK